MNDFLNEGESEQDKREVAELLADIQADRLADRELGIFSDVEISDVLNPA